MTRSNPGCTLSDARLLPKIFLPVTVGIVVLLGKLSFGQPARPIWLSSLDVSKTVQSTGRAQVDKSYTGKPLSIAGRKFDHGLGTHALSGWPSTSKAARTGSRPRWASTTTPRKRHLQR